MSFLYIKWVGIFHDKDFNILGFQLSHRHRTIAEEVSLLKNSILFFIYFSLYNARFT